jgi:hypothetical protein
MKSLLAFTNVLLPLILGGCAMGWSRPNTTEAEFKLDRFECEQQAASMYPVLIASIGSGEAPSPANCSSYAGHMNCTATSGSYVAPRQVGQCKCPHERSQVLPSIQRLCFQANKWSVQVKPTALAKQGRIYSYGTQSDCNSSYFAACPMSNRAQTRLRSSTKPVCNKS